MAAEFSAVAAELLRQIRPIGQSRLGKGTWKEVEIKDHIVIKGGHNTKFEMAPGISYTVGNTVHHFVQLSKNVSWFSRVLEAQKQ